MTPRLALLALFGTLALTGCDKDTEVTDDTQDSSTAAPTWSEMSGAEKSAYMATDVSPQWRRSFRPTTPRPTLTSAVTPVTPTAGQTSACPPRIWPATGETWPRWRTQGELLHIDEGLYAGEDPTQARCDFVFSLP